VELCADGKIDPGPVFMRRLTNSEYAYAVRDLLGIDAAATVAMFPADLTAREFMSGRFDNTSVQQTISTLHGSRYMAAATQFATSVVTAPDTRAKVFGCDPTQGDATACLTSFVSRFGRRAYRRPVTSDESQALLNLAASEPDKQEAASLVLQAMLMSPNFLFRVEVGAAPNAVRPDLVPLTGYELATRIGFFMLGRTPDDALLDAAAAGRLDTAQGAEEVTRGLLSDPRMRESMTNFASQWLQTNRLPAIQRDPAQFPSFGPELMQSMQGEFTRLLDDFMFTPKSSFLDLYTAPYGYADAKLAAIYGTSNPGANGLGRVDFSGSADRGGFFTTPAFLTATTRGNDTSVIQRGLYVRQVVLCDELPQPPPGITPPEVKPGESALDAETRHTVDPVCAGCHVRINPVGHGLERYDAIGQLRTKYPNGQPVSQSGHVDGLATPDYAGGVELGRIVKESPSSKNCAVAHGFRWAMGRPEALPTTINGLPDTNDACTLADLGKKFAGANYDFSELVVALVTSDAFRYRRVNASQ
jgi:Protein of unknown function (DUF1592)/Protein of unknown function (DUF1588)/Protein of unknown function (DUF1595)/Protein of unknown function (DUF1587)/Protein of unknown function (DUF1585)